MSDNYIKFFQSILDSSLWGLDSETRIVFVTLLGMVDPDGIVRAALPGIARRANVSLEATEAAMTRFQEPDPYSRDPQEEGRRVVKEAEGWRLVTYFAYRERQPRSQQMANERVRKHRENKKQAAVASTEQVREEAQGELSRAATLCNTLKRDVTPCNAEKQPETAKEEEEGEEYADNRRSDSASADSVSEVSESGAAYRRELWTRLCRVVMHRAGEDPEGRDPPEYRDWWKTTSTRVVDAGGIGELEGWVKYAEDCRSPQARSAKDLGGLKAPARWLAKQAREFLAPKGVKLPKAPVRA